MSFLQTADLKKEESTLLKRNHFGFRVLAKKDGDLARHFGQALLCVAEVECTFLLALGSCISRIGPVSLLCRIGCLVIPLYWYSVVLVLAVSVVAGKLHKRIHRKSVCYWAWWPVWKAILATLGAVAGLILGWYMWDRSFAPYYEISELQRYRDVDTSMVPGERLQDAGILDFSVETGIDRARGGCFVNKGHTYCVAPIVKGGELDLGMAGIPKHGSYDYFAVGKDCCNCPNQDFRCGEWDNPFADGGLRSIDWESRPFYRLAVDEWSSSYQRVSKHPLFVEWVQDPAYKWRGWFYWAANALVLAACLPVPIVFVVAVLIGRLLHWLVENDYATPLDTPAPPQQVCCFSGERAWKYFVPEMYQHYWEEQKQLLAVPISDAPWYTRGLAQRAVPEARENPQSPWAHPQSPPGMEGLWSRNPGDAALVGPPVSVY